MSNLRINQIKSQTPITILVGGGNRLGYLVAKTLIEQGSYVVIIDKFNNSTKKYVSELKKSNLVDFFDYKGFDSIFKNIKRFDYVFYFLNEKLKEPEFDSKEFLSQTKYLEQALISTKKNNAKFTLITSLLLNKKLADRIQNEKSASPSPYSNVELQKYCENLVAEFGDKTDTNLRIIRLGTLLGKGIDKIDVPTLDAMFRDAVSKPQITIYGEGLDIHNLINEDDATYGLLKLTFSDSTKKEVITLANKNNYTTLSIAYKLLELNTEAQSIRFVDNPNEKFAIQDIYVPAPHASKYGWTQQISLEESCIAQLQNYYGQINKQWNAYKADLENPKKINEKNTKISKTKLGETVSKLTSPFKKFFSKQTAKKITSKTFAKGIIISILTILFAYFLAYPIIASSLGLYIINKTSTQLSNSFFDLDKDKNLENIQTIDKNIDRVSDGISNIKWLFTLLNKEDLYINLMQMIQAGENTSKGAKQLLEAVSPFISYIKEFEPAITFQDGTPSTTKEYRQYLNEISKNSYKLNEASYKLSLASEIMTKVNTTVFPSSVQGKILDLKDYTKQIDNLAKEYKEASTFLPTVLGKDERQRYLILLQNESEIRATGGWPTSYGVLGIEGGQIREIFVDDIYNADGTLKIQGKTYTPPESMAKALNLTKWSFSLANWYPDLSDTHDSLEKFTKDLGIGSKIDGVITIDIAFLQKLLDKWGGIQVPGEDEIITSQNIYPKIFEMHEEFEPGSTQKASFLANLANEVVKKIFSMKISDLMSLKDVFVSSLDEKHIQATFRNSDAYAFFNKRNWAGSLDDKFNSAPAVVDWNWGGNKANLFLDKNHALKINIKNEKTIDFAYTLSVENKSTSTTYPYGDYINYERVYIPSDAVLTKIEGFENNKFDIYKENGFKVIGGWFNTKIQSISTLKIEYTLQKNANSGNFPLVQSKANAFFDINIFKQAGEKNYAYKLDITYPVTWKLQNSSNFNNISNQLSSRFELNSDKTYSIVWNIPN